MALPVEINPLHLQTSGAYSIAKSLRFRSSATANLSRTFGASGNTKTWTFSTWMKRGQSNSYQEILSAGSNNSDFMINKDQSDGLHYYEFNGSTLTTNLITTPVFRDFSAWYHIMLCVDTTQATASNRVKIYVNGVQITTFSTATYPSLNATTYWNSNIVNVIGAETANSRYLDGYLAEVNFIDGQQLTPSSFGAYDTNGVWQPKKYSGTYGTNGFYLTFGTTTSTATLGNDSSGNGNTWTVNNVSLTAGSTYDSMTDSPTVSSASVANYAVLNPLNASGGTYQDGDLTWISPGTDQKSGLSTIPVTTAGSWYCEITAVSKTGTYWNIGVSSSATAWVLRAQYRSDGATNVNGTAGTSFASYTTGDIIGVTYNSSTGVVTFYKNNVSQGTLTVSSLTTAQYFSCSSDSSTLTSTYSANFGQRPFSYSAPTGFNALNTYNLPTPTIANGAQQMAATLYTGTNANLSVNNGTNTTIGTTFQPDLAWFKLRSGIASSNLIDAVRGVQQSLSSDLTAAEATSTSTSGLLSFASTGLNLGTNISTTGSTNGAGGTYVVWQWQANKGSTVSNTAGTITSTVSANTTGGFSIVTYTGTGVSNATVGHGLVVTPNMIILKDRNTNTNNNNWQVYHSSLTTGNFLSLNTTDAQAAISGTSYGSVGQPTSTNFKCVAGSVDSTTTNQNTQLYVAYCWAAVAGYSAFGSYTGNGSADGPFVYTGFRPRFVLIKVSSTTGDWAIQDSSRSTYNAANALLWPDLSNAEYTTSGVELDYLSNGFKIRNTNGLYNTSGQTYIYAAFAENPFQNSRAR